MTRPTLASRPGFPARLWTFAWKSVLWAVPFAVFFFVLNGSRWPRFGAFLGIALLFSAVIRGAMMLTEWAVIPRLPKPAPNARFGWLHPGLSYTVAAMAGTYLAALLTQVFVWRDFAPSPQGWLITGMYGLLFSVTFGGVAYARAFYRVSLERAAQVERIRAELARAELRALRAQIHPHFLFNALNTIAALIAENPPAAEDVVTRLAEVFRFTLAASGREHTRLGDEIEFLRSYLGIEGARMGPRLAYEIEVDEGLDDAEVPSLLLQPLVENAVRWGAGAREGGGCVHVAARAEGSSLVLTVTDDGPGFTPGGRPGGTGVGLESVRERLRLAGAGHSIEITSGPGTGTRITLRVPLSTPPSGLQP